MDGGADVACAVSGEAACAFLSREERTYTGCPYLLPPMGAPRRGGGAQYPEGFS